MQIDTHWHQILGLHDGAALSGAHDCNAFALETGDGLVLFDAGAGVEPLKLAQAFSAAGFPDGPRHLFLTHGHADHAGGAAEVADRYRSTVHAGALTAQWLETADEAKISLDVVRRMGAYPSDFVLRRLACDRIVEDGASIRIGEADIVPLFTPGHSADHFSYLVTVGGRTTLVGGDAIFTNGTITLQNTWDSSVAQSCATIRKLAAHAFDALLPGHGPTILENAGANLNPALARIDRLLPPLNFL